MKRTNAMTLFLIVFLSFVSFSGCQHVGKFPYSQHRESVDRIEVVQAVHSEESVVLFTIPQDYEEEFWKDFEEIDFHRVFYTDAPDVHGIAIRIVYADGCYDILNSTFSVYIFPGKNWPYSHATQMCCNREDFDRLIDKWNQMSNAK